MSHWTPQPIEIFLPKFHDLQVKVLVLFTKIFSLLQKLPLLQRSIPYFKITRKKWSHFNV